MDVLLQALSEIPGLVEQHQNASAKLAEAKRDIEAQKGDRLVTIDWVCQAFGVSKKTAILMLADEMMFVYGRHIKRFKLSTIIMFAERNGIEMKNVDPLPDLLSRKAKKKKR